jgi:hypothetical protein
MVEIEEGNRVLVQGADPLESSSFSLDAVEARKIEIDASGRKVEDLVDSIEERRRKTLDSIRERLIYSYRQDLERLEDERIQELLGFYYEELDTALSEILSMMEEHGDKVGPLRHRIAWLVGYPDPDPGSRRRPPDGDFEAQVRFDEAARLRAKLSELDDEFRRRADELLASAKDNLRLDLADWGFERAELEVDLIARAEEDALAAVDKAFANTQRSALDPDRLLPSADGASVVVEETSGIDSLRLTPPEPAIEADRARMRLEEQAKVFADSNGWSLTSYPDKGRDRTEEFLKWRKELLEED